MTTPLEVDETQLAVDVLTAALGGARVGTELPANLQSQVPFVQVFRIGGPDDGYVLDMPTMAVHAFATDSAVTDALCREAVAAFRAARGTIVAAGVITRVRKLSGPLRATTEDQKLRHSVALVQLRVKFAP